MKNIIEEVFCRGCDTYYSLNELEICRERKRINMKDMYEKYLICPNCEDNSELNFIIGAEEI